MLGETTRVGVRVDVGAGLGNVLLLVAVLVGGARVGRSITIVAVAVGVGVGGM